MGVQGAGSAWCVARGGGGSQGTYAPRRPYTAANALPRYVASLGAEGQGLDAPAPSLRHSAQASGQQHASCPCAPPRTQLCRPHLRAALQPRAVGSCAPPPSSSGLQPSYLLTCNPNK